MSRHGSGLLNCSICGADIVELHGTQGAVLITRCSNCGVSSESMAKQFQPHEVQVYYRRQAPESVSPP